MTELKKKHHSHHRQYVNQYHIFLKPNCVKLLSYNTTNRLYTNIRQFLYFTIANTRALRYP